MKLKTKGIIQLIINIATAVCIFIPAAFLDSRWMPSVYVWGYDVGNYAYISEESVISIAEEPFEIILALLIIFFTIVGIVYSILLIVKSNNSILKIMMYSPVALLSCFILLSLIVYADGKAWCWYILLLLIIVNAIISFLSVKEVNETVVYKKKTNSPNSETSPASKEPSEADMLIKYKDLLDKGIITEEEFDDKKRNLLSS